MTAINCRPRLAACLLAVSSLTAPALAKADVTIINQSNSELVVSVGFHVNGKVTYKGWAIIPNGGSLKVYVGNDPLIILSVYANTNGNKTLFNINQNFGVRDYLVSNDPYVMEEVDSPVNLWKLTDTTTGKVYFKSDNNPLPDNIPTFTARFFVVSGNQDQTFLP
jgi:hypothetical protein